MIIEIFELLERRIAGKAIKRQSKRCTRFSRRSVERERRAGDCPEAISFVTLWVTIGIRSTAPCKTALLLMDGIALCRLKLRNTMRAGKTHAHLAR